jgi:hypothetical protein
VTCPPLETVAAWTLDELGESETVRFEEHYFSCDACLQQVARMHRLVAELAASLPTIVTAERRRRLEAQAPLQSVSVRPGERATMRLGLAAKVGLWLLHAPLQQVTQVDFEARGADGGLLFALADVPFDAQRGEVVLACQVHYRALAITPELRVRLTARSSAGSRALGDYILNHEYDSV